MKKVWILVASRAKARIFSYVTQTAPVQAEFEMENPSGHLRERDLVTDRPGRATRFRFSQRNPLPPKHSATEHAFDQFAATVAHRLADLKNRGKFDNLVLVAEPHALGKFRSAVAAHKNLSVVSEVPSDLLNSPDRAIDGHLKQRIPRHAFSNSQATRL